MQAIILAAGYATRLFPLTKDFPKALLSVGGKPMLDHLVEGLNGIEEISRIHVVTNSRFYSHFLAWAQAHHVQKLRIYDDGTYDDQTKLGAIGDMDFVRRAAGIDEDCLVVAGDNLLKIDLRAFCDRFAQCRSTLLLCQKQNDIEVLRRFAVATADADGRLTDLVEKPAQPKSDLGVFALYLYPANVFKKIPEYLAEGNSPDAPGHFPEWLLGKGEDPVYGFVTQQPCFDIGTHESLRHVRALYGE